MEPRPIPEPVPPGLLRARRERLLARLGDGVALLPAAPQLVRSRDSEVRYRPDSDLFYLTGCAEPEALAVLTPHDDACRFTLFVRERDPEREVWSGRRLGVEGARERTGADAVHPLSEMGAVLPGLVRPADRVCHPLGRYRDFDLRVLELVDGLRRGKPRTGVGPRGIEDLDEMVGAMRRVKDAAELEWMRAAAKIAAEGHLAAMAAARPGAGEWEIEAALEHRFRALGASGPAFPSIVGSGANATILHYVANDRRMEAGDLVLVDAGADLGMYCSDISRTFPVSGRFTSAQRDLYEIVLAAEQAGLAAVRPGAPVGDAHDAAVRELVRGLIQLGILPPGDLDEAVSRGDYRRFYMHQTSHWLGLDVHDAGLYRHADGPVLLEPGMVLTVEPGLYLPDSADLPPELRGVGVRIEDVALVTEAGREILTSGAPVRAEEVEGRVGESEF